MLLTNKTTNYYVFTYQKCQIYVNGSFSAKFFLISYQSLPYKIQPQLPKIKLTLKTIIQVNN